MWHEKFEAVWGPKLRTFPHVNNSTHTVVWLKSITEILYFVLSRLQFGYNAVRLAENLLLTSKLFLIEKLFIGTCDSTAVSTQHFIHVHLQVCLYPHLDSEVVLCQWWIYMYIYMCVCACMETATMREGRRTDGWWTSVLKRAHVWHLHTSCSMYGCICSETQKLLCLRAEEKN